jgi:hypothetical protein
VDVFGPIDEERLMAEFSNQLGVQGDIFGIGTPSGSAGILVKNATGIAQVRNASDTAFADIYAGNIRANNPVVGANDTGAVIANGKVRHGTGVQSYGIGTGAVIGNARGIGATDLQTSRAAVTQVASGARSFVCGQNCTAAGDDAIAGGLGSSASGAAAVALGEGPIASGAAAIAVGHDTEANGIASFAAGHLGHADADYSVVLCKEALADAQGMIAFSGGAISTRGDSQSCLVTWGAATANAVPGSLGLDGVLGSAIELVLPNDSAYGFDLLITAEIVGGSAAKAWTITGGIRRPGAGAAVFVSGVAPVAVVTAADAALATATVVVTAPGGGVLRITVTGVVARAIHWTASARISRATG